MKGRLIFSTLAAAALICWMGVGTEGYAQTQTTDNPAVIYTWRYEKDTVNGQDVVKRKKMTWDEGQTWDKEKIDSIVKDVNAGKVYGVPPGSDPTAIATWKLYYDQLDLWQKYLEQTVFVGMKLKSTVDDITWSPTGNGQNGQAAAPPGMGPMGGPTTGAEAVVASNQGKSLDQQTKEFFSLGGAPKAGQNPAIVTREQILQQVINLYQVFEDEGKTADEDTYKRAQEINTGLTDREGKRLAYRNWLDDRKEMVVETAQEWGKRQQGQVVVVNGVQYELYSPSQGLPKGAGPRDMVRVVTDHLTPYDLLNPDGSQKEPEQQ